MKGLTLLVRAADDLTARPLCDEPSGELERTDLGSGATHDRADADIVSCFGDDASGLVTGNKGVSASLDPLLMPKARLRARTKRTRTVKPNNRRYRIKIES